MAKGIDVSKYQGRVDWAAVKPHIDFAILKAGFGRHAYQIDPQFERNYAECKKYGIPVGCYWYSYAKDPADAEREGHACVTALHGKQFEYPVWYDIEYEPDIMAQSRQGRTDCIKRFCKVLEDAGFYTGVYCSRNFINSNVYADQLVPLDLWVAAYTGVVGKVALPYGIWQYGSANQLHIPGFGQHLDCNEAYKDYPSIIKGTGLNGYGKPENKPVDTFTVTVGPITAGDVKTVLAALLPVLEEKELEQYVTVTSANNKEEDHVE